MQTSILYVYTVLFKRMAADFECLPFSAATKDIKMKIIS